GKLAQAAWDERAGSTSAVIARENNDSSTLTPAPSHPSSLRCAMARLCCRVEAEGEDGPMGEGDRKTRRLPMKSPVLRTAAVTSLSHRMGEGQGEGSPLTN